MIKVYIASPYSIGDKEENVKKSLEVFHLLFKEGFIPYAPLLTHYVDKIYPNSLSYEEWLDYDFIWLKQCEAVLRLEGESSGADREVQFAKENKIPVFYSMEELRSAF